MPRIRTIKPEILEDEKTGPLSDTAFRLFTSMIALADDHGNVRADVRWLTAQIWWAHTPPPNVLLALVELTRSSLIDVYGVRGGTYAHLRGWEKHQRIDNAGKGRVPLHKSADAVEILLNEEALNGESPQSSASRGEIPLDPDLRPPTSEGDMDGEAAANSPRSSKPKSRRRSPGTAMPATWEPRARELELAKGSGLDGQREAQRFRNHHAAKGSTFVNWDAAFAAWLDKAKQFADERQGRSQPQTGFDAVMRIATGQAT